jgi:hypothetical protein
MVATIKFIECQPPPPQIAQGNWNLVTGATPQRRDAVNDRTFLILQAALAS